MSLNNVLILTINNYALTLFYHMERNEGSNKDQSVKLLTFVMPEKGTVLISNIEQNIIKKYVPNNIQLLSFSLFLKWRKITFKSYP